MDEIIVNVWHISNTISPYIYGIWGNISTEGVKSAEKMFDDSNIEIPGSSDTEDIGLRCRVWSIEGEWYYKVVGTVILDLITGSEINIDY